MCLPIKVRHPDVVLSEGEHLGYEWATTHNQSGYRCGYIRVPKGHPWHGKEYDDVPASAHGGLTFSEPDMPCDKGGPEDAYWLGFDCAHHNDAQDPELPASYRMSLSGEGIIRTQSYVEDQCRSLCEQAAEAVKGTV